MATPHDTRAKPSQIIARAVASMERESEDPNERDSAAGSLMPQPLPCILYEDALMLVVGKPAGMVTHPAYKHPDGTLCDAIFARQAARGERRPWLLHRLDRETSGVLLFAKTDAARRALVRQFERHTVRKRYLALIEGNLTASTGEITLSLRRDPLDRRRVIPDAGGQAAQTRYHVIGSVDAPTASARLAQLAPVSTGYMLALVEPLTGRTHQIRAHFAALGYPLAGDTQYGATTPAGIAPRVMLHAWRIGFRAPMTGVPCEVAAPPPADLLTLLRRLGLARRLAPLDTFDIDMLNTIAPFDLSLLPSPQREEPACD